MECERCREALSARLDGEDPGVAPGPVEAHLAGCGDCRAWGVDLDRATRRVRLSAAEPVPDLTTTILAEAALARQGRRARRSAWTPGALARLLLVVVSLTQLGVALPALFGEGHDASVHVAREQGSWELALAVGLLGVAVRPRYAAGLVPVSAVLGVALVVATALDVASGRTSILAESSHALPLLGLVVLVAVQRLHRPRPSEASALLGL